MTGARWTESLHLAGAVIAVGIVTWLYVSVLHVANAATVSTTFLLVVLVVAAISHLWVAVVTSIVAMCCFNYFFRINRIILKYSRWRTGST